MCFLFLRKCFGTIIGNYFLGALAQKVKRRKKVDNDNTIKPLQHKKKMKS